ncbi:MAG: FecR domain-containing protein, partial [Nitratireductor sp.]|nr:FecR domain-containing protein [Nitratireductor sp.]
PPDLVAPNGAFLSGATVTLLAGPLAPGQYAQNGDIAGLLKIGKVQTLEGEATATHSDGTKSVLAVGEAVYQGDIVETGDGSKLGVSFIDNTVFSMSANARMVLNELIFDPAAAGKSSMVFNLVEGAFVFVAGEVAPNGNMQIVTPIATMGIRGTTPKVLINSQLGVGEFTVLPDPDTGHVGSYVLINPSTGAIIGRVDSDGDKWVVTSLSNEAVRIGKTGFDLLEDKAALDELREVVSHSLGDRTQLDGANSFDQISFNSNASRGNDNGANGGGDNGATGERSQSGDTTGDKDDPPIAADDAFTVNEDTILTGSGAGEVNVINGSGGGLDIDPDGFAVTVTQVNGQDLTFVGNVASVVLPSGAILLISQTGNITYDGRAIHQYLAINETAQDSFTYTIEDLNGYSDTATVTITIEGLNDSPIIQILAGDSAAESLIETNSPLAVSGTLTLIDVDVTDSVNA